VTSICCAFTVLWMLASCGNGKQWNELVRSLGQKISASERELTSMRSDLANQRLELEREVVYSQREDAQWAGLTRTENDPSMRAIISAMSNGFQQYGGQVMAVEQELGNLKLLTDSLTTDVQALALLQPDIEAAARVAGSAAPTQEQLTIARKGIVIVDQHLWKSTDQLTALGKRLADYTAASLDYGKQVQELSDGLGTPADRIKQWEKEVMQTELQNTAKEEKQLKEARSLAGRLAHVVLELHDVVKAQEEILSAYK